MAEDEFVEAPRFLLLIQMGLFLIVESVAAFLSLGLGLYIGDVLGYGATAGWALGTILLVCFGVVKTWSNVRFLDLEYRGELDDVVLVFYFPYVFPRPTLNAAVRSSSEPPERNGSPSNNADPRLLAGVGLGLPLFVLGVLSVSTNAYLVFLIPVVAFGALYGLRRFGPEPIRPPPYHVGLSLTLTYSFIPFGFALLIVLYEAILPTLPDVFPHTVIYHWSYSALHVLLVPLALLTVLYVTNYCLLLAYDIHRARKGVLPKIAHEDAETTPEEPDRTSSSRL